MVAQLAPCPQNFNMAAYVLGHSERLPNKCALQVIHADRVETWSYRDLRGAVSAAARYLIEAGLSDGDRVLLRMGRTADYPISYLACIWAGLIPVPLSSALAPPEIEYISRTVVPKVEIVDQANAHPATCLQIDKTQIAAQYAASGIVPATGDPNRPAYIVFTSGTSGQPRAVVHAHRAVWARQTMHRGWYGLQEDDRLMHAGAMNWTFTMGTGLMDPWSVGATAIVPGAGQGCESLVALIAKSRATIFAAAPGIYRQLLRTPMPELPHLRHGLSAGEKLPEAIRARWRKATGTEIYEAFGMSECSTFISSSPSRPAPPDTIGCVQRGRCVKLFENGVGVDVGNPGEIAIHKSDPGLMLEYWNANEETAARFNGEWFMTGDLAREASDGSLEYLGRKDDMLNAGGVRVSPLEIEVVMRSLAGVEDCAACEVRVSAETSVIALFYVANTEISEHKLEQFAHHRLAAYKTPRVWARVDEMPRGANNKLHRRKLRAAWESQHGQT